MKAFFTYTLALAFFAPALVLAEDLTFTCSIEYHGDVPTQHLLVRSSAPLKQSQGDDQDPVRTSVEVRDGMFTLKGTYISNEEIYRHGCMYRRPDNDRIDIHAKGLIGQRTVGFTSKYAYPGKATWALGFKEGDFGWVYGVDDATKEKVQFAATKVLFRCFVENREGEIVK